MRKLDFYPLQWCPSCDVWGEDPGSVLLSQGLESSQIRVRDPWRFQDPPWLTAALLFWPFYDFEPAILKGLFPVCTRCNLLRQSTFIYLASSIMSKRKSGSAGEAIAEPARRSLRLRNTEGSATATAKKTAENRDQVKPAGKKRVSQPNRRTEEVMTKTSSIVMMIDLIRQRSMPRFPP